MRISSHLLTFILLLCLSSLSVSAEELPVTIVSPQDNLLQHEQTLSVIVRVDPERVDAVKVIASTGQQSLDVNRSKAVYCQTILLKLGENRITIRSYKSDALVDEQIRRLYVTSPIHQAYKYPPKIYEKQFFHTDANEAECARCHDMSVNEKEGVAFIDVTESNCYGCHQQLTREKYAHAPAVNWLCTSCHNGEVGSDNAQDKGRSKYLLPEPVNALCFKCHKENRDFWKKARYRHEPLDSGRCNKCHNSHSTPYNMSVRKPSDQICLGCHQDKHVKAQRLKGSACAGASAEKRCVSCHTPHASSKKFFIKEENKKKKKRRERENR
ncbi:MAG: cytochrome c3 family protein [Campylobacterota bacterium]